MAMEWNLKRIPEAELRRLKAIFDQIDSDGSGGLDFREMKMGLAFLIGRQPTEPEIYKYLREFDVNKNGVLSFDEFLMMCKKYELCDLYEDEKPPEIYSAAMGAAESGSSPARQGVSGGMSGDVRWILDRTGIEFSNRRAAAIRTYLAALDMTSSTHPDFFLEMSRWTKFDPHEIEVGSSDGEDKRDRREEDRRKKEEEDRGRDGRRSSSVAMSDRPRTKEKDDPSVIFF
uniref:EF-hand domain-containing protein n=1 Tax=Chromera velia CCMP2878 TaxID=1169474 RepID=A0A0G4HFV3_9ALVE|eukprot:Cvel_27171.t1-p1 / transcript=Cvel_27171.t1 / gene=Cvel_27171 / organism=Chromera_velia_CCMP2878 / gene_product=Caltractin, putative / transcript_product=Caltractin, putative / location=Cvel_scaffold3347:16195-16881(-) / protein_length=229 / sequence_SO=supercontig / SO=protein_coding / is_pseudo=false